MKGIEEILQSLSFANVVRLRLAYGHSSCDAEVKHRMKVLNSIPFLHLFRNHLGKFLLLHLVQIALKT